MASFTDLAQPYGMSVPTFRLTVQHAVPRRFAGSGSGLRETGWLFFNAILRIKAIEFIFQDQFVFDDDMVL